MIAAFNRSQLLKGAFLLLASVLCYAVAWLFFRYGLGFVFASFHLAPEGTYLIAIAALALISWSGYRHWKDGDGFKTYIESALYHDLGDDSAGAVVVDHYARRITGPAYVLSQVFLGGPLLLLRGIKHFQQRLPNEAGLEQRLHQTLGVLRTANKWQAITDYPEMRREILILAQMKKIDFSAHKGTPRIKAPPPDGI